VHSGPNLDATDDLILQMLGEDARQPATDMADRTGLSSAAVRRRIARLERLGVIAKYTVVLDHDQLEPSVEAYVGLSFAGDTNVQAILEELVKRPEVREASTLAGEPDAMVRLRVRNLDHLRDVVNEMRQSPGVTGSKTMVALGRMRHGAKPKADGRSPG